MKAQEVCATVMLILPAAYPGRPTFCGQKGVCMHDSHDVFVEALRDRRKVVLTYSCPQRGFGLTGLCIPVDYKPGGDREDSGHYYFWHSGRIVGERLVCLSPSDIGHMRLSDQTFDPSEQIITETG